MLCKVQKFIGGLESRSGKLPEMLLIYDGLAAQYNYMVRLIVGTDYLITVRAVQNLGELYRWVHCITNRIAKSLRGLGGGSHIEGRIGWAK